LVICLKEIEGASERALELFVGRARRAVGLSGAVDVMVTTDQRMRQLNRQFRGKDKTTDVLSFPAGTVPWSKIAGEVAISRQIAIKNGRIFGHGSLVELKILVLHGILHLAGYDHESDNGEMARKEQELRRELGLPDGLIARVSVVAPAKSRSLAPLGMTRLKVRKVRTRKEVRTSKVRMSKTKVSARKSARSGK
jgi:probable rRNA maturation factor